MDAWKKIEQAVERSRLDIIELDRRVMRFDAQMGGAQAHLDTLYHTVEGMKEEMGLFRQDMMAARQGSAAVAEQMVTTTTSVLQAYDSLASVSTPITSLLEQVAKLASRVDALEHNRDNAA